MHYKSAYILLGRVDVNGSAGMCQQVLGKIYNKISKNYWLLNKNVI